MERIAILSNQEAVLRAKEFLRDQILSKNYQWDTSRMKLVDSELYVNNKIGVGGFQELLLSSSIRQVGVTNFDGNRLAKDRIFVINGVTFGFALEDDSKEIDQIEYKFPKKGEKLPEYLSHANLVLKQAGEIILNLPIRSIWNGAISNRELYRELGALELIEDNSTVNLTVEYPTNTDAPAGGKKLFVSVFFRGFETYSTRVTTCGR